MSEHRLNEIVIERPRSGRRISLKKVTGFKKQLNKITEEASEDGLLRPYLIKPQKCKHLSDHLGPLRRLLRSKVGQPWDAVYSELCQRLDSNTMTGQHVLGHVWDYVERHVELIDGIPYRKPYDCSRIPLDNGYRDQFYVHPETGLLCAAAKKHRQQKQALPQDVVVLDEYRQYRQLHGIWYLVTFEEFPRTMRWVTDALCGLIDYQDAPWINNRKFYAARKQQCNKREIRFIMQQLSNLN